MNSNYLKIHNDSNNYIEWLVAIAVAYATVFTILESFLEMYMPLLRTISGSMRSVTILLLLCYQIKHYGLHLRMKLFVYFFLLYSFYILFYLKFFPVLKMDLLSGVPGSQSGSIIPFLYRSLQVLGYLLCAQTILNKLNPLKFLIISFFGGVVPSVSLIQFIGVDTLQFLSRDDEIGFSVLALGYCNTYSLIISIIFFKKLTQRGVLTSFFVIINIISIIYVLLIGGERGPIIWGIVNLVICSFFLFQKAIRIILLSSFVGFILYLNFDIIIQGLSSFAPRAAEKIEMTVKEGDTNGRFDTENEEKSAYLIGLNQFSTSPIYGSYFRLVGNNRYFLGGYPHNVFIEMLITMGVFGFIPFMIFLYKSYKKVRRVMKKGIYTEAQLCCLIIFLSTFLQLQTTWSIVANAAFWLFFYIMCIYDNKIEEKTTKFKMLQRIQNFQK